MAGDKRRSRKRLRRQKLLEWLLTFGFYTAADHLPGTTEERARGVLQALDWLVDGLHRSGYSAPHWLWEAGMFYWRLVDMGAQRAGPTPDDMERIVDRLFLDLPEEERPAARRAFYGSIAGLYEQSGTPFPEWLEQALDRYGEVGTDG